MTFSVATGDRFRSVRSKSGRVWTVHLPSRGKGWVLWPDPNTGARTSVGTAGGVKALHRTTGELADRTRWEKLT